MAELSLNLKTKKQTHPARAVYIVRLNNPEVRHIVTEEINNRLTSLQESQLQDIIESLWKNIKNIIVDTCKLHSNSHGTAKPDEEQTWL